MIMCGCPRVPCTLTWPRPFPKESLGLWIAFPTRPHHPRQCLAVCSSSGKTPRKSSNTLHVHIPTKPAAVRLKAAAHPRPPAPQCVSAHARGIALHLCCQPLRHRDQSKYYFGDWHMMAMLLGNDTFSILSGKPYHASSGNCLGISWTNSP